MNTASLANFDRQYRRHLKHLKFKGLQPKTIEAYARAIRRNSTYFDHRIEDLNEAQLTDYFSDLVVPHSWSSVKLDLHGLRFFTEHVLRKSWVTPGLIKPPKTQRLPDIVTVGEARELFAATRIVSYRVFYFSHYSLGLRLGEGLQLRIGDIDAGPRTRAHSRRQGQPGPVRSTAASDASGAAALLGRASQPRIAVSQPARRIEGLTYSSHHTEGLGGRYKF